jgi:hypothetical protein
MNRANQLVGKFGDRLEKQYGFLADPSLPLWKNLRNRIRGMKIGELMQGHLGNVACHNLLTELGLPRGTKKLLRNGLNYCLKSPTITGTTKDTFDLMEADTRRMYHMRGQDSQDYIKGLYVKSEYKFKPASDKLELEEAMYNFKKQLKSEQLQLPLQTIT